MLLLSLLRWLKANTNMAFEVALLRGGALAEDFARIAPTTTLTEVGIGRSGVLRRIGRVPGLGPALKSAWRRLVGRRMAAQQPRLIYANSVGTASLVRHLAPSGVPVLVHVHELERAIRVATNPDDLAALKGRATRFVAISAPVRENLIRNHGIEPGQIDLIPTFVTVDPAIVRDAEQHRANARRRLGIPDDALVVGGCGGTDWRKGADLFVDMAEIVAGGWSGPRPVHFVWVGKILDDEFTRDLRRKVEQSRFGAAIHFTGEELRPVEIFCGYDVFVLSSREEPMGMVALEAAAVGRPIVCFADAGGMPEFVGTECGRVVGPMTPEALAGGVMELLADDQLRVALGQSAKAKVGACHHVEVVGPRIENLIRRLFRD
jgi:glycosyltransferase involved in cell wall biosynthesis